MLRGRPSPPHDAPPGHHNPGTERVSLPGVGVCSGGGFAVDDAADEVAFERRFDVDLSIGPANAAAPAGPRQFAASLRKLASHQGVDETLQLMVDLSVELIAGCDLADVMLVHPSGATTPVATDPLAVALDRAQVETEEGPCLHVALDGDVAVRVDDLGSDVRWPSFGPAAVALGVCSALSYRLYLGEDRSHRIGALNLYGHHTHAFDARAVGLGEVLAAQCATVLGAAIQIDGLHTALASRDTIGQAKGILMERYRIDGAAAFDLLRTTSQQRNIKLTLVAEQLIEQRRLP